MNRPVAPEIIAAPVDTGLRAIVGIAGYYRIAADAHQIERELALTGRLSNEDDLSRAARLVGLKARVLRGIRLKRLLSIPTPAILRLNDGSFTILLARGPAGECRIVNPITKFFRELPAEKLLEEIEPLVVLVTRRFRGEGYDPKTFGFRWFLPSILRYRKPLAHVLLVPDIRVGDADLLPGGRRQGPHAQRLLDVIRAGCRPRADRALRCRAAISADLRAFAHTNRID